MDKFTKETGFIKEVSIQKLAGYIDIRTTEIYCNITDEEKVRAIECIRV